MSDGGFLRQSRIPQSCNREISNLLAGALSRPAKLVISVCLWVFLNVSVVALCNATNYTGFDRGPAVPEIEKRPTAGAQSKPV